jgi:D-alanyl-D-alanine carboxypeptidase (penicillin-binding protein 5/6)
MQRPREERSLVGVLDDPPEVHHRDAVADVLDDREVVRDEQISEAELGLEVLQQIEDLRLNGHIERRNGFVADEQIGPQGQCPRDADTLRLLRYGLSRYHRIAPVRKDAVLGSAALKYRDERVDLVAARTVMRVARRGERVTTTVTGAPAEIEGPMGAGTRVGTILVHQRGRVVDRVGLVTARDVPAATLGQRLGDYLGRGSTRAVLAVLALCSLYLALMWRRLVRRRNGAEGHGLAS